MGNALSTAVFDSYMGKGQPARAVAEALGVGTQDIYHAASLIRNGVKVHEAPRATVAEFNRQNGPDMALIRALLDEGTSEGDIATFLNTTIARIRSVMAAETKGGVDVERYIPGYDDFCRWRWAETGGTPICPLCKSSRIGGVGTRLQYTCKDCRLRFSATTGTCFSSRKLSWARLALAIGMLEAEANAMTIHRALGIQYRAAWEMRERFDRARDERRQAETRNGARGVARQPGPKDAPNAF